MDAINRVDTAILLWIQAHVRAPFATPVVTVITHLADGGALWVAVTLALLIFRRTRRIGLTCAISMLIGLVVVNLAVKPAVARVRPYEFIETLERIIGAQLDASFPSGHTTHSLACAWVIFRRAPRRYGVPALALAALIGLSRLYVGVHYPTDVLAGALIGIACAEAAMRIERRIPRGRRDAERP